MENKFYYDEEEDRNVLETEKGRFYVSIVKDVTMSPKPLLFFKVTLAEEPEKEIGYINVEPTNDVFGKYYDYRYESEYGAIDELEEMITDKEQPGNNYKNAEKYIEENDLLTEENLTPREKSRMDYFYKSEDERNTAEDEFYLRNTDSPEEYNREFDLIQKGKRRERAISGTQTLDDILDELEERRNRIENEHHHIR